MYETLWPDVEKLLATVQKPARYIGGELGAVAPTHLPGNVAWLLIYPDTYEIGLPNQGLQILYEILNERHDALAERAYAPWVDMEAAMRDAGVPLFSLENHLPARSFDVLAFNLSAELVYTNVLNLIDLAGVPLHTLERTLEDPLVLAGGHCAFNPEPLAEFVDAFVLGDGEEVVAELTEVLARSKTESEEGGDRHDLLATLASLDGVYVPSLYRPVYDSSRLVRIEPLDPNAPETVEKRTISDLALWPYPRNQLIPLTEVVHDRLNVEVFRGCTRGCRFCQAGMVTRPVRERPFDQVGEMTRLGLDRSGYDEVALTSLSTADFSGIQDLVRDVVEDPRNDGQVSVSLPSLRVDAFTVETAAQIQRVKRTGLTFAPEGGTWRMRKVINKLITEEDLYKAVDAAFSQGWRRVKLYFLIGLPTERDEDVLGIAELGKRCVEIGRRYQRSVTVVASVGGFVPKAQTPFQWFGQDSVEELQRKVTLLRNAGSGVKGFNIRWHDPEATVVEGLVSRGDRRIGAVIERVWRAGGTFQEWSERFDLSKWQDALARESLSFEEVAYRDRDENEALPWDHISAGLHRDFLWSQWQDALAETSLEDCRWTPCYDCGACTGYGLEHVVASALPPAGGSQGTGQDLSSGQRVPVDLISRPSR
ncbi:MAG: TIGR03960 family B12-binding radical SAM protein [Actinobacteria bacterium]|nr:TIGR03960 family B12-binding radical SAM protein [Actinomycetota bacterium]MCL5445486.1 TIGR03960 family B12-binding radical SAM protein [Actinomycetota bacterium]